MNGHHVRQENQRHVQGVTQGYGKGKRRKTLSWKMSEKKRAAIYEKSNGRCFYCGAKLSYEIGLDNTMHIDHITPRAKGGRNNIENLNPSCKLCNLSKGKKNLDEYRFYIATKERFKNEPVTLSKDQIEWLAIHYGVDLDIKYIPFFGEKHGSLIQCCNS